MNEEETLQLSSAHWTDVTTDGPAWRCDLCPDGNICATGIIMVVTSYVMMLDDD
jgi:hypothetical protein